MSAKRKRDKRTVAIVDVRKRIEQRHKEFLTKKLIGHHGTTCEAIVNEMCLVKSLQFMPPGLLPLIASFVPGIITTWREIADAYAYNLGAAPVAGWEMHVQLGTNVELRGFATPDDKGECRIDIELSCPCTDADMIRLVFDAQPDHRFFFFTTEDTGKQQQQKLGPWAKLLQPHLHHSKLSMLAEIMSCKKYDISGIRHKLDPKNGEVVSVSFLIDGIIGIDGSFPLLAMPPEVQSFFSFSSEPITFFYI